MRKQMRQRLRLLLSGLLLLAGNLLPVRADEGMWPVQDIDRALEKKMQERGLQLSAGQIYDADAPGASLADAVVSLNFACTASVLSERGLILTNHHCAYSHLARLSTPERNLLETGFWAMHRRQEIRLEGEKAWFLKQVYDVTDDVEELKAAYAARGEQPGSRKIAARMEELYRESSGLEAVFSTSWAGEKAWICLYKVYDDIRLVAAPPVSIGYFGGETDNYTWPRHNGDFALYRIYENDAPVRELTPLRISLDGYAPGSFTMVLGYPGSTDRTRSSAGIGFDETVSLPLENRLRERQISLMRQWMDTDPDIRRKYAATYFNLTNLQSSEAGKALCLNRFRIRSERRAQEEELQAWIDADPGRKARWGTLVADLKKAYAQMQEGEQDKILYRASVFTGTQIGKYYFRAGNAKTPQAAASALREAREATDPRLERDLLEETVRTVYTAMDSYYFGEQTKTLARRFGTNYAACASWLWENSLVAGEGPGDAVTKEQLRKDPLYRFFTDISFPRINQRNGHLDKWNAVRALEKEYTIAMYRMQREKGRPLYPDANGTMRLSYGTVGGCLPRDGVEYNWFSRPEGILQKADPERYEYTVDERQRELLENGKWGRWGIPDGKGGKTMHVNFLADNDITGGNSGSPVLNGRGELIGVAFDGTGESLSCDAAYSEGYNKCICTDIRYILWVLDRYAGMKWVLRELELANKK